MNNGLGHLGLGHARPMVLSPTRIDSTARIDHAHPTHMPLYTHTMRPRRRAAGDSRVVHEQERLRSNGVVRTPPSFLSRPADPPTSNWPPLRIPPQPRPMRCGHHDHMVRAWIDAAAARSSRLGVASVRPRSRRCLLDRASIMIRAVRMTTQRTRAAPNKTVGQIRSDTPAHLDKTRSPRSRSYRDRGVGN